MKKIFSLILCLCMMFTVVLVPAKAETNYCSLFSEQWSFLANVSRFGNETTPWDARTIVRATLESMPEYSPYLNLEKTTEYCDFYSFPKEYFESIANKLFDVKVDLTTAIEDPYSGNNYYYDPVTQTYNYEVYPMGGGRYYKTYGYIKNGEIYTVYMHRFDPDTLSFDKYLKCTATVNDGYAKLFTCEEITSLPDEKGLITSDTKFEETSTPASSAESTVSNTTSKENTSTGNSSAETTASNTASEVTSTPSKPENKPTSSQSAVSSTASVISKPVSASSKAETTESKTTSSTASRGESKPVSSQSAVTSTASVASTPVSVSSKAETTESKATSSTANKTESKPVSSQNTVSANSKPVTSSAQDNSSEASLEAPELSVITETKSVKIEAEESVFQKGTVIDIQEIADEKTTADIKTAVEGISEKFVAFDITAKLGLSSVQPNGKLLVTFTVPDDYDINNVVVLYVSDDKKVEKLDAVINAKTRTATVELSHLSTYVVAEQSKKTVGETSTESTAAEKEGSSSTVIIIIVVAVILLLGAGFCLYFFVFKKKKEISE